MGEFWNSFNADINNQEIPVIQKYTYLTSRLREEALQAIRKYDVAPENYELIREILIQKYGESTTIQNHYITNSIE